MLVLLDENLPHGLRSLITDHEVRTLAFQGWASLANSELIAAAEEAGFDVMLTADKGIRFQHDMSILRLAIVILPTNRLAMISPALATITDAIEKAQPGTSMYLDFPGGAQ